MAADTTTVADSGGGELLMRGCGWRGAGEAGVDGLAEGPEGFGAGVELVWESLARVRFEGELGCDVVVCCLGLFG